MTIKDIAAIAGVSITTVSMVINNKADSISEETREKVLRIIREYNFKPYSKVLQNTSAHSGLVGLLIPGSAGEFSELVSGAQEAACAAGYSMILCAGQETEKYLNNLSGKSVDGVALYLAQEACLKDLFSGVPRKLAYAAVSNLRSAAGQCTAFCAFSDASKLATEHLLKFGHRRIALIGWRERIFTAEYISGYSDALRSHEIILHNETVCLCSSEEDIARNVRKMTYREITAFICQDERIAACVYRTLGRYGLQIPKNCSVVSISGNCALLDIFTPSLSVVDLQFKPLGRSVMQTLIARIEGTLADASGAEQILPHLRQGDSVAPPLKSGGKRIIVVGSMHMDVIIHMSHIPTSGESLISPQITNLPGGKGANQAVGAAKLGGDVYAFGCLGDDQEGRLLYSSLVENGVNTSGVHTVCGKPTGKAYILVAENGDSSIVFSQGSNGELGPDILKKNTACFEDAEFCLLSTEIPWETVLFTIDLCVQNQVKVILKPTTPNPIPPDILKKIFFLIPNEKELEVQAGGDMPVEEKAARLFACGAQNIIVTLGEKGCYLHSAEIKRFFPAADFTAVDTTGAADAFISAFAVYLSECHSIVSSIKFATYAAGISVTRDGVQPALAERTAVEMYSDQYGERWTE